MPNIGLYYERVSRMLTFRVSRHFASSGRNIYRYPQMPILPHNSLWIPLSLPGKKSFFFLDEIWIHVWLAFEVITLIIIDSSEDKNRNFWIFNLIHCHLVCPHLTCLTFSLPDLSFYYLIIAPFLVISPFITITYRITLWLKNTRGCQNFSLKYFNWNYFSHPRS